VAHNKMPNMQPDLIPSDPGVGRCKMVREFERILAGHDGHANSVDPPTRLVRELNRTFPAGQRKVWRVRRLKGNRRI